MMVEDSATGAKSSSERMRQVSTLETLFKFHLKVIGALNLFRGFGEAFEIVGELIYTRQSDSVIVADSDTTNAAVAL